MKITKYELEQLKLLKTFRSNPPTAWTWQRPGWKLQWLSTLSLILGSVFFFWGGWPLVGAVFLGYVLNNVFSYICFMRKRASSWHVSKQIVDWEKLDELIEAAEKKSF